MPGARNDSLRIKPPRCDDDHPKAPRLPDRKNCPKCRAWDRYVGALRRDDYASGRRKPGERQPVTTQIVKEHRCLKHRSHPKQGCDQCRAWRRYQAAERRLALAQGTLETCVDAAIVRAHLQALLDKQTGGWHLKEITRVTGLAYSTVQVIARGQRTGAIFPDTWNAIRALKPKGEPVRHRTEVAIEATEARRIVQGLNRQGWTLMHMSQLMGHVTKHPAARVANGENDWISPKLLEEIRSLRDKLGEYDIARLPRPLPGMRPQAATYAARRGWEPLIAWAGQDIADPHAVPYGDEPDEVLPGLVAVDQGDDEAEETYAYVDPILRSRVLITAEKVDETTRRHNQRAEAFIESLGSVTRLEAHAVAWMGANAGMNATQIAAMLGYSMRSEKEVDQGQRQVNRLRTANEQARAWIDSHQEGETPAWFTAPRTAGRKNINTLLPALMALQPEPYGAGWSVAELAEQCGVTVEEMRAFLAYASTEGDRPAALQPKGDTLAA